MRSQGLLVFTWHRTRPNLISSASVFQTAQQHYQFWNRLLSCRGHVLRGIENTWVRFREEHLEWGLGRKVMSNAEQNETEGILLGGTDVIEE